MTEVEVIPERERGEDTLVRCDKCGAEQRVSFGMSLRSGWPKCHGYTMRMIETKADVGAVTTAALRSQTPTALATLLRDRTP